ncbi:unnamed protein product [Ixodes hexagonus]
MGRQCFVPWCDTGYKSCRQKYSLFSAPKDPGRLQLWRQAIPREDRAILPSDYVCERHFEPRFVSKTWTKEYNGYIVASAPRRASLTDDAVPSIFPERSAYPLNPARHRKRATASQCVDVPKRKHVRCNYAEDQPDDVDCGHGTSENSATVDAPQVVPSSERPQQQVSSVFDVLFESSAPPVLPSKSWGCHRLEKDGTRSVVFSDMQRRASSSVISAADKTDLVTTKIVDIDQDMRITVAVIGRSVPLDELCAMPEVATVEDVRTLLRNLHEASLCAGGPKRSVCPKAQPENTFVDVCDQWRHKECPLLLHGNERMCQWCSRLSISCALNPSKQGD